MSSTNGHALENRGLHASFDAQTLTTAATSYASRGFSLYYFTYYNNPGSSSQDYYSGYTYDRTGKYTAGSYYDYNSNANETGYNGKYYISSAYTVDRSYKAYKGQVYVTSYYDADSSQTTTTPYYVYNGYNGLGSEYGYLTSNYSTTNDLFGYDYYEADV